MSKINRKHLTRSDRRSIEDGLRESKSVSAIAKEIGVPSSTVSREIKRNISDKGYCYAVKSNNHCKHRHDCDARNLCRNNCAKRCASCKIVSCSRFCGKFLEVSCPRLRKTPFCCNSCHMKKQCSYRRCFYSAATAHTLSDTRLRQSRSGIDCSEKELEYMVAVVKKGLKNNQSFYHIFKAHPEFPITSRTFYNYQAKGIVDIKAIEMPAKVRYKPRGHADDKRNKQSSFNPERRTYEDFRALDESVKLSRVEMDCVVGRVGDTQAILTLHFVRFEFQLMILLKEKTQDQVRKALDWLEECLEDEFIRYIPLILTDRGSEFKDFRSIEGSRNGGIRTHVYYCDPMRSDQKGSGENNHRLIRKIVPKKVTDFDELDSHKLATLCSHVNSYKREHLGGLAPIALASQMLPKSLFETMGISLIEADEVNMSPRLLGEDN